MRVLLLGGTTEASALAAMLADEAGFAVILSLAGVTSTPRLPRTAPGIVSRIGWRIGGFGGIDGLCAWLRAERIDVLADATHPYATQMTSHAVQAAGRLGLPYLRIERPAWQKQPGDRWIQVSDAAEAASTLNAPALNETLGRVLLTVGTRSLPAFRDAALDDAPKRQLIVRCIDAPDPALLPKGAELLLARGPFTLDSELALLLERQVAVLVSKNSGGSATAAKLDAARKLAIPVILIDRPAWNGPCSPSAAVADAAQAHAWLLAARGGRGME